MPTFQQGLVLLQCDPVHGKGLMPAGPGDICAFLPWLGVRAGDSQARRHSCTQPFPDKMGTSQSPRGAVLTSPQVAAGLWKSWSVQLTLVTRFSPAAGSPLICQSQQSRAATLLLSLSRTSHPPPVPLGSVPTPGTIPRKFETRLQCG